MTPPWKLVPPSMFSRPKIIDYQNTKGKMKYQKVIDYNDLLGYVVLPGGGRAGSPVVRPIYRGQVFAQPYSGKDYRTQYIFDTFRTGDRLNDYTYQEDPIGYDLAQIALSAIRALEARAALEKLKGEPSSVRPKKQTTAKKPRKRKKA